MTSAVERATTPVNATDELNLWCAENGVRFALPSDEDEIFALLAMAHAEIGIFKVNRDKVRAVVRSATARQNGIIGVIEKDSRIVGTVGLSMGDAYWYTTDQMLFEIWNFVHPEFRRSNFAKVLIDFTKKCSDWFCAHGTHVPLFSGVVSNKQTEQKCILYRRRGLKPVGQFYIYNDPSDKSR
jgi:hypothetical protein